MIYNDLGIIDYKSAWDYQEDLVHQNREIKSSARAQLSADTRQSIELPMATQNYLLFCEHPAVYTLGKSGSMKNVLLSEAEMEAEPRLGRRSLRDSAQSSKAGSKRSTPAV